MTSMVGTPLYMAPERWEGSSYSLASELWTIGIILYQMYYKTLPIHAANLEDFRSQLYKPIHIPASPQVPTDAQVIMKRLLEINPDSRITLDELWNHPFIGRLKIKHEAHLLTLVPTPIPSTAGIVDSLSTSNSNIYDFDRESFAKEDCSKPLSQRDTFANDTVLNLQAYPFLSANTYMSKVQHVEQQCHIAWYMAELAYRKCANDSLNCLVLYYTSVQLLQHQIAFLRMLPNPCPRVQYLLAWCELRMDEFAQLAVQLQVPTLRVSLEHALLQLAAELVCKNIVVTLFR